MNLTLALTSAFCLLLACSAAFYVWLVLRMFLALGKVRLGRSKLKPKVSVLVAARNEEANLAVLLDALLAQDYEGEFDIWLADDRSTDQTPKILEDYAREHPEKLNVVTITELAEKVSPKKHAITKLVESCSGELLLLTDADCRVPKGWISGIVKEFEPGIDLVAGNSYLELPKAGAKALLYMQGVETMSYRIAGTAGLALRMPLTSTGNNLAYRKSFFAKVEGFKNVEHIQSGDDDLLMQKAVSNPWSIRYCVNPETFVATDGKATFKELWEQRKRWASKTIYYTPRTVRILASIFVFFVCISASPFVAILDLRVLFVLAAAFLLKIVADLLLFRRGLRLFRQEHLFKWFIPVEVLHAPFTVLAVLFGILGKFQWKN